MNKYTWMVLLWVTFPISITILFMLWLVGVWACRNAYFKITFSDFIYGFKYWYLGYEHYD